MPAHSILLIEDSPGECELFRLALAQTGFDVALHIEHDAEAALHYLTGQDGHESLPSVILLDWHLQTTRGETFLTRLRADTRLAVVPVVVFTTSDAISDMAAGYRCGANGYMVKPGTFEALGLLVHDFCRYWLQWNRTAYQVESTC